MIVSRATQTEIENVIRPILQRTYGKGSMVESLVEYLAGRIKAYPDKRQDAFRSREDAIMHVCWDWMTGGTTAESVAREIEAALNA